MPNLVPLDSFLYLNAGGVAREQGEGCVSAVGAVKGGVSSGGEGNRAFFGVVCEGEGRGKYEDGDGNQ